MRRELSTETKRKLLLFACIVWFINTGIWVAMIVIDLYYGFTPTELTMLRVFTALASLFAAIANLLRYRGMKTEREEK